MTDVCVYDLGTDLEVIIYFLCIRFWNHVLIILLAFCKYMENLNGTN